MSPPPQIPWLDWRLKRWISHIFFLFFNGYPIYSLCFYIDSPYVVPYFFPIFQRISHIFFLFFCIDFPCIFRYIFQQSIFHKVFQFFNGYILFLFLHWFTIYFPIYSLNFSTDIQHILPISTNNFAYVPHWFSTNSFHFHSIPVNYMFEE